MFSKELDGYLKKVDKNLIQYVVENVFPEYEKIPQYINFLNP